MIPLLIVAFTVFQANAIAVYPTVAELQRQLGARIGEQLPKGVIWNGRGYFGYVVGARELGGGRYDVTIQLR